MLTREHAGHVLIVDAEALGLFSQHEPSLRGLVGRIIRDYAYAEDILQETFIKFNMWLQKSPKLRSETGREGQLVAYLYTIAKNLAKDHVKKVEVRQRDLDSRGATYGEQTPASNPVEICAAWENSEQIEKALPDLPDRQREVVMLHFYEGLDDGEIGSRIGVTPEAARKLKERGIASLERLLHAGDLADGTECD